MAVGPRIAHVEGTEFEYRLHDAGCNLVSEPGTTVRKPLAVGGHTGTGVTGEYVAGNPRRGPVRRGREPLVAGARRTAGATGRSPGALHEYDRMGIGPIDAALRGLAAAPRFCIAICDL